MGSLDYTDKQVESNLSFPCIFATVRLLFVYSTKMAAGMLHIAQINAQLKTTVLNFTPPVKFLDPADCSIEHSAGNLRAVQDYSDRTSIPTNIRGDSNNVTSLAAVNTIVANFHIVSLSAGLQTQFTE